MFIGIFGIGQKQTEPRNVELHNCPSCNTSEAKYFESYSYFHFFFIPIFKFSKKGYLQCSTCSSTFGVETTEKNLFNRYEIKETYTFKRRCPSCEHPLNSTDNYCPHCGFKIP